MIDDALAGEPTRGASTITMQTVKNLYLWHRPFGIVRKVVELPLAVYFDLVLPKRRIMEIYLNIAEWGPGHLRHRGGRAASFRRLGQEPDARQAALLAVDACPIRSRAIRRSRGPGLRRLATLIERRAAQAPAAMSAASNSRNDG